MTAKKGLERCLKASFVVRNGTKAQEERIYQNGNIKDAINDTQPIIDSLNETKLSDYCTDGFKAAQLQKLIDVGLITFDTPYVLPLNSHFNLSIQTCPCLSKQNCQLQLK